MRWSKVLNSPQPVQPLLQCLTRARGQLQRARGRQSPAAAQPEPLDGAVPLRQVGRAARVAAEPAPVLAEGQASPRLLRGPVALHPDVAVPPPAQVALRRDHGGHDEAVPLPAFDGLMVIILRARLSMNFDRKFKVQIDIFELLGELLHFFELERVIVVFDKNDHLKLSSI